MHVKLYLLIAFYLTKNILVCLQALRYLRTSEIKPFIIFIKPPSSTCFLESRLKYNAMFTSEDGSATPCSVSYRPLLIYINIILFHSTISSLKLQNLHMYIIIFFVVWQEGIISAVIEKSAKLENNFGHLFDFVIVNDDISRATEELIKVAGSVSKDLQWVPAAWVEQKDGSLNPSKYQKYAYLINQNKLLYIMLFFQFLCKVTTVS